MKLKRWCAALAAWFTVGALAASPAVAIDEGQARRLATDEATRALRGEPRARPIDPRWWVVSRDSEGRWELSFSAPAGTSARVVLAPNGRPLAVQAGYSPD